MATASEIVAAAARFQAASAALDRALDAQIAAQAALKSAEDKSRRAGDELNNAKARYLELAMQLETPPAATAPVLPKVVSQSDAKATSDSPIILEAKPAALPVETKPKLKKGER